MSKRNQVGIRLAALNGRVVEAELRKFGAEGHAALGRIQKASKPARAGLKAVDDVARDLRGRAEEVAKQTGVLGTALTALGPAGTAVAVGIGALVLALGKSVSLARDAAAAIAEVGDAAKRAGVDVRAFQELAYVAEQNRIAVDTLTDGLKELSLRADEFLETGAGPAAEAFERLGYSAADLKTALEDPSALLVDVIARLQEMDKAAQIRISDELFGGSAGERFVELIEEGADAIRMTVDEAHRLGLVIDQEAVREAKEVDKAFRRANTFLGTTFRNTITSVAYEIMQLSKRLWLGPYDTTTPDGLLANLGAQRVEIEAKILSLRAQQRDVSGVTADLEKRLLDAQIKGLEERMAALGEAEKKILKPGKGAGGPVGSADDGKPRATADDRAKALSWQERLLTIQERRAQVMAEIDRLEQVGLLTSGQAASARVKAEADLQAMLEKATSSSKDKASEEMLREVTRLIDAAQLPAEELAKRLARIAELEGAGSFEKAAPGRGAEVAERARVLAMRDYLAAAEDTEAALRKIEEIAESGAGAEAFAARITLAERAGKGFAETMERAGEGIADSLTDAIFEAKSLGDALQGLARQIARDFVNNQFRSMLGGGGGIFGAIGSLVGGLFGGGGGAPLNLMASVRHGGGMVGSAGAMRSVPASVFAGARRFHGGGGLGPGERPVIALEDEYVMTRAMQGNLVETLRALGTMGAARSSAPSAAPVVNILTPPGHTAETRETRGPGGAPQIDVIIKPLERALARSVQEGGPLQGAIGKTFGLNRARGLS
jgi:hypothetical protein